MDKIINFDQELDSQVDENEDNQESVTESTDDCYLENNEADQTIDDIQNEDSEDEGDLVEKKKDRGKIMIPKIRLKILRK